MSKYPVGPKTIERASKTEPGKMAALLNRVLYVADTKDIPLGPDGKFVKKYFVCNVTVHRGSNPLPKTVPVCNDNLNYFNTEQLLLAIRDYLEAAAIREVCE